MRTKTPDGKRGRETRKREISTIRKNDERVTGRRKRSPERKQPTSLCLNSALALNKKGTKKASRAHLSSISKSGIGWGHEAGMNKRGDGRTQCVLEQIKTST